MKWIRKMRAVATTSATEKDVKAQLKLRLEG